ncbi:DMT family transporter [Labilibaculum euxinus]|uniref:EamA family transporter n=1 Tax=Labilibaculum euxinus TaxID=2686357 RepID=A0A7M4D9Y9_9BACT|nr:DMT family transporter [Labilibaculum euxinus]MUP39468.1 EamA family transporter [Labilibaculum euxinus]MVB08673.1 EamA family transporter [Labilibaculum euxinus]
MIGTQTKGTIMVLLSAVFFGLLPFFAIKTYAEGFDVSNLLLYRFSFAFVLIGLFCIYKKISIRINKKQFFLLLILAFVGTMMTTYTLFLSYQYISSGLASTLHFVYPIITIVFAGIVYKEKFTLKKLTALFLSIIGIALLSLGGGAAINATGVLWALVSGLFYAIYILCMANPELRKISPYSVAFWIFGISAILFFGKCFFTNNINTNPGILSIFYIVNLSFWSTFLSVVLFYMGMKHTGPGNASLLSTLEPLTGVMVGVFVFNDVMDLKSSLAILLILTSVFMVMQNNKKPNYRMLFIKLTPRRLRRA